MPFTRLAQIPFFLDSLFLILINDFPTRPTDGALIWLAILRGPCLAMNINCHHWSQCCEKWKTKSFRILCQNSYKCNILLLLLRAQLPPSHITASWICDNNDNGDDAENADNDVDDNEDEGDDNNKW